MVRAVDKTTPVCPRMDHAARHIMNLMEKEIDASAVGLTWGSIGLNDCPASNRQGARFSPSMGFFVLHAYLRVGPEYYECSLTQVGV